MSLDTQGTCAKPEDDEEKETGNWWWKPESAPRPICHHPLAPFHLVDFLMQFRWIVIIPIVLPLSFMWARVHLLKAWVKSLIRGPATIRKHLDRVERVRAALEKHRPGYHGLVCTARPSFWSVTNRDSAYKRGSRYEVDLSDLADVVEVDMDRMIVKMEPYVTMGYITATLLKMGVCIPIVPEYDDLTVGGLVCGYGIEGSSHKYGLFYDEVVSMEIVLAGGRTVTATRDNEYSDLFYAIPWSYGAIGMLVGIEMRIIKVKPYMKVTYYPVAGTIKEMCKAWNHFLVPTDKPWAEYVEGLMYSSNRGVIMTADYVDYEEAKQGTINRMGYWFKPWFHKHVKEAILDKTVDGSPVVEYVPTRDYYHRHTRSLYWEADLLVPMGNHVMFRWFLGWLMPPRVSFLKLTTFGKMWEYYTSRFVAQDILVPLRKTAECMELMHDEYDIYPLWLCPHRVFKTRKGTMLDCEKDYDAGELDQGDTEEAQMYTDLGIWYTPGHILRKETFDNAAASHKLEQWLIGNHGYQTLYAISELNEEDFWKMFDKTLYQECREKYKAQETFMDVYYKVGRKNTSASALAAKK
ncbi:FAD linked oxidase [Gracilaria domingensis]|nr:FAD linked oxidase [Gracilaria domingensis]